MENMLPKKPPAPPAGAGAGAGEEAMEGAGEEAMEGAGTGAGTETASRRSTDGNRLNTIGRGTSSSLDTLLSMTVCFALNSMTLSRIVRKIALSSLAIFMSLLEKLKILGHRSPMLNLLFQVVH